MGSAYPAALSRPFTGRYQLFLPSLPFVARRRVPASMFRIAGYCNYRQPYRFHTADRSAPTPPRYQPERECSPASPSRYFIGINYRPQRRVERHRPLFCSCC